MPVNITTTIAALEEMQKKGDRLAPKVVCDLVKLTLNLAIYTRTLEAELRRVRGVADGAEAVAKEAASDAQEAVNRIDSLNDKIDEMQNALNE